MNSKDIGDIKANNIPPKICGTTNNDNMLCLFGRYLYKQT